MTPKEKANEIGNKFYQGSVFDYDKEGHILEIKRAKDRALICVREIVDSQPSEPTEYTDTLGYWKEVMGEIHKL